MKVYKFLIPNHQIIRDKDGALCDGYMALAIAESVEEARALLKEDALKHGSKVGWLDIVEPQVFDLEKPCVLGWAET